MPIRLTKPGRSRSTSCAMMKSRCGSPGPKTRGRTPAPSGKISDGSSQGKVAVRRAPEPPRAWRRQRDTVGILAPRVREPFGVPAPDAVRPSRSRVRWMRSAHPLGSRRREGVDEPGDPAGLTWHDAEVIAFCRSAGDTRPRR